MPKKPTYIYDIQKINKLSKEGKSLWEIAKILKLKYRTMLRYLNRNYSRVGFRVGMWIPKKPILIESKQQKLADDLWKLFYDCFIEDLEKLNMKKP